MSQDRSEPSEPPFLPVDDGFHIAEASDKWWETETAWFSFHNAERRLGGWLYTMVRPNIGTVAGGVWVWDDSAWLPWEVPYSTNYSAKQFDPNSDLKDIRLPTGVAIKVLEPMMSYALGYDDPGRLSLDLRFDAAMAPRPLTSAGSTFGHARHFDQVGRVTGHIELHGQHIAIACWAVRDRTWGVRPEDRPRQAAYVTGAADGDHAFLAVTNSRSGVERIAYGFLRRAGRNVSLIDGTRDVVRDPKQGWVTRIEVRATDADGGEFVAVGESVSRIIINRHTFIDVNSLVRWQADGMQWWGEDQDMWPMATWSAARRAGTL